MTGVICDDMPVNKSARVPKASRRTLEIVLQIRTSIIEGSLAYRMRRADAARANECGLQILNLPQLAARLVGGFVTPVTVEQLDLAIQRALGEGGFVELESVRHLPGMTRAVSRGLRKVWNAGVRLDAGGTRAARIGDLALIEERVRSHLPKNVMLPHDLRNAAVARVRHAVQLVGPVKEQVAIGQCQFFGVGDDFVLCGSLA